MPERFFELLALDTAVQRNILSTLIILILILLARLFLLRLVNRQTDDVDLRYRWRKGVGYVAAVVAFVIIGRLWLADEQSSGSLLTYFGLLSAGIAIALQDLIINFVGWIFILVRRPFDVGDRIQIDDTAGDVIDTSFFQFTLLEIGEWVNADQSTGRIVHLPNRLVFSHPLANYSLGIAYIWHEIPVTVTFESDWQRAKHLLNNILEEHMLGVSRTAEKQIDRASQRFNVKYGKLTPTIYTSVGEYGVTLTMRFIVSPRQRRGAEHALWEDILRAFAPYDNVDLAYPTRRHVVHQQLNPQVDQN